MKRILAVLVLCAAVAIAADAPKLTDTQKLSIRNAQVEVQQIQLRIDQLQQQYSELAQQKQQASQKLSDAIKSAFTAAKLSEEDYTLDGNLELIAKPKTPKPDAVPPSPAKGTSK